MPNQISDTGGAAAATTVFDRNEYLREKRYALVAWATLLEQITGMVPPQMQIGAARHEGPVSLLRD